MTIEKRLFYAVSLLLWTASMGMLVRVFHLGWISQTLIWIVLGKHMMILIFDLPRRKP